MHGGLKKDYAMLVRLRRRTVANEVQEQLGVSPSCGLSCALTTSHNSLLLFWYTPLSHSQASITLKLIMGLVDPFP
jgi:hypothetical protein